MHTPGKAAHAGRRQELSYYTRTQHAGFSHFDAAGGEKQAPSTGSGLTFAAPSGANYYG
jgi:hypothetical protein